MRIIKWIGMFALLSQSVYSASDIYSKALMARENKSTPSIEEKTVQGRGFFKEHGILFFFSSKCRYCLQFAPVVKQYMELNKAEVLPLSFDNQGLPSFPKFIPASKDWVSVSFGDKPITYPALFIVNPKTRAVYPVSTGSYSYQELNQMMNEMIDKIKDYEGQA